MLEPLDRQASEIAHGVASEVDHDPPLVAGNLSNTNVYVPGDTQATSEVRAMFEEQAHGLGIDYLGLCCGAGPHHVRAMAEALGRRPPASRYSPDMSRHFAFGTDPSLAGSPAEVAERL